MKLNKMESDTSSTSFDTPTKSTGVNIAIVVGVLLTFVAGVVVGAHFFPVTNHISPAPVAESIASSSAVTDAGVTDIMGSPFEVEALTKVKICDALKLYGNAAVAGGLCRALSTNNLWVCEITGAVGNNPDVHLTFNAATELHVTVRTPTCEGNAYVQGTMGHFTWVGAAPAPLCNVVVTNYLARLNAVPVTFPTCIGGFNKALSDGKINAATQNFYATQCRTNKCA